MLSCCHDGNDQWGCDLQLHALYLCSVSCSVLQAEAREAAELKLAPLKGILDAGAQAAEQFRCNNAYRYVSLEGLFAGGAAV